MDKFQNSSVMRISFSYLEGLKLCWNFQGLLNSQIYYKHLFLIDKDYETGIHFVSNFFKKIKQGDLYKVVFQKHQMKKSKWMEKQIEQDIIIQCNAQQKQCNIIQSLEQIAKDNQNYSQTLFVYIFVDQNYTKNEHSILRKTIASLKLKNYLKFIVNIIGNGQGVNYFKLSDKQISKLSNFIRWYINQIVVFNAYIQIQCENGSITSQTQSNWRNIEFNKIRKDYYGITRRQTIQRLSILDRGKSEKIYHFKMNIYYKLLNQHSYQSEKYFNVSLSNLFESHLRTENGYCLLTKCMSLEGLTMEYNPFYCSTTLMFQVSENEHQQDQQEDQKEEKEEIEQS